MFIQGSRGVALHTVVSSYVKFYGMLHYWSWWWRVFPCQQIVAGWRQRILLSSKTGSFPSPPSLLFSRLLPLRASRTSAIKENVIRTASELAKHRHLRHTSSVDHHLWHPYLLSHITIGVVGRTRVSLANRESSALWPLVGDLLSTFIFVCYWEAGCTWVETSDCMAVLYMRCCCAELWGRSGCMLLQSCAVCCAFLLGENVRQKNKKTSRRKENPERYSLHHEQKYRRHLLRRTLLLLKIRDSRLKTADTSRHDDVVVCELCVLFTFNRSFYPSTSSTTSVRTDSSILDRYKFCSHKTTAQINYFSCTLLCSKLCTAALLVSIIQLYTQ